MKSITTFLIKYLLVLSLLLNVNALVSAQNTSTVEDNISATIDKDTSEADFKSITEMLSEYGITADFNKIKRNNNGEITSISLTLSSDNSQTKSSYSSNSPIQAMTFGSKNGQLYIKRNNGTVDLMDALNDIKTFTFSFDGDSLFGNQFSFRNFLNDRGDMFMYEGDSLDLKALMDKIKKQVDSDAVISFFKSDENSENSDQTFRFVDNPDLDKLIIIDGDVSDFKTLDDLSKADQLEVVDVLKPKTAMSLYGDKAKDGAIIATTKK